MVFLKIPIGVNKAGFHLEGDIFATKLSRSTVMT